MLFFLPPSTESRFQFMGLTSEIQSFTKNYYPNLTVLAYNDSYEKSKQNAHNHFKTRVHATRLKVGLKFKSFFTKFLSSAVKLFIFSSTYIFLTSSCLKSLLRTYTALF